MRIVFAGSPAAAVPSLRALVASGHEVTAVLTREDSPFGRKRLLTPTPVAEVAVGLGLPVIKANRLAPVTEELTSLDAELGVIVAYGGLVREPLLSAPRHGWINLHFSLLPRWRGAAPVQRAIMAGDDVTGASVFQLVEELDAGPVYGRFTQSIGRNETAGHLLESLADAGAGLLVRVVDAIADGSARAEEQVGEVTLAPKLGVEDGRIDWNLMADAVHDRIRGATPEPGAFTMVDGHRLKILDAVIARDRPTLAPGVFRFDGAVFVGTATDPMELVTVQPAGKKPMRVADWWRGLPSAPEGAAGRVAG
ncbi:methionyl-tRNA formyltransferase [Leifsonia bigeumensis]|uniref:Methionyl-tRNA formyltransferase n=1 Tax=Leifsonella bigeumensis TaxID=433643 RepID=A0ABP7FSN0_9MICO